jgi:hypothetical protein
MCCKLYDVPDVQSVAGKWCRHCAPGKGCAIHATRPEVCQRFFCGWMVSAGLGPEWKPERAKLIIRLIPADSGPLCIAVDVDEGFPAAWQRADIYTKLKRIAASSAEVAVRVCIGRRRIVVLPDRDVDVGVVGDDEEVEVTGSGALAEVRKVKRRAAEAAGTLTSSHAVDWPPSLPMRSAE